MRQRLLLIDDDPALRTALSDMLSFHFPAVEITAVDSGSAALVEVSRHEYDLVLCDLIMPEMDGIATITEIHKISPHLRVYLMTGHPEPHTVFHNADANGYLKKPLERTEFLARIKSTLHAISLGKQAHTLARNALEALRLSKQRHDDMVLTLRNKRGER